MDSSTLQDTVFLDNVAHISGKKQIGSSWTFCRRFFWTREVLAKSGSGVRREFALAEVCAL